MSEANNKEKHEEQNESIKPIDMKEPYYKKIFSPGKPEKIAGTKDIIMTVFKQLKIGMELSKVMLPVEFCEARTLLEKLTDVMTHIDILTNSTQKKTQEERIIEVCRWAVSGWYIKPKVPQKPFNPVLGEVFRGRWVEKNGSVSTFFAEQVSHHPPISAFFGENKKAQLKLEGYYYPQSRFLGNSAASIADGYAKLYDLKNNDVYKLTWPDYFFRGLFWGNLKMEVGGTMKISCEGSDWSAYINYIQKPVLFGEWYTLEGKIKKGKDTKYYISGKWTDKIYIQKKIGNHKKGEKKLFFDAKNTDRVAMQWIKDLEQLRPYESHKLWRDLYEAVNSGNLEKARTAKHLVEQAQRDKREERKKKNETFKHRFFKKDKDNWKFIGHNHKMYTCLSKKNFVEEEKKENSGETIKDEN